jgi:hypothetical protein
VTLRVGELSAVLDVDTKPFDRGLDSMPGKFNGIVGLAKGAAGAMGAAFAAVGVATLGKELFDLGVQVETARDKASTVFGDWVADVDEWADANAKAMGLTDDQLTGLAANFGDLLKPMGFTSSEASNMAQKVVGLSGALSAWTGGQRSAAEVSDILSSAMLGERDALKSLGINISEADVTARLAAKGQEELTGAALEQAKALATQELIFEKSTDAQKAWAATRRSSRRTSSSRPSAR